MASLLLLTQPLPRIISELSKVLEAAAKYSSKTLYIHWDSFPSGAVSSDQFHTYHSSVVSNIYQTSSQINPSLDVRVVLHGFKLSTGIWKNPFDVQHLLVDFCNTDRLADIRSRYESICGRSQPRILLDEPSAAAVADHSQRDYSCPATDHVVAEVVIGGTFDHIHTGHKILLSESVMRTRRRLTVGMADGPLLAKKALKELIAPCPQRMARLREFLRDIDPTIEYNLVPITEPMGPTSWDRSLQLIVVSEETEKAVAAINTHRERVGLNVLKKYVVALAEDTCRSKGEETKHSSSSMRRRRLGTRLKTVQPNGTIPQSPYIIGLAGGSASGKTNVAAYLATLGASVVDCDALGHRAYAAGSSCHERLVREFGAQILLESGELNRGALGAIVFQNDAMLRRLNGIVWPEIANMAKEGIDRLRQCGASVVVLDAAVLIKAEWTQFCHETWVCFVKEEEALKRIMERDGKSAQEAAARLASQMSNENMLAHADIAFCSEFEYDFTRSQVRKAWDLLKAELKDAAGESRL